MSQEWTDREVTRQVDREHTAKVEGLDAKVIDESSYGARWVVHARLDDFHLMASSTFDSARTVDEAKAEAEAAARRLVELGARAR
jgi:hypothetical protein